MSTTERFTPDRLTPQQPSGLDAITTLRNFAIITYAIAPEKLRAHLPARFEPDCVQAEDGRRKALISVVPFLDIDFHPAFCPWPNLSFGQTNYRAYVRDNETGERVAWFFGTCLDSFTVHVPRHAWKLPWHRGRIRFDCRYSLAERKYEQYVMSTESAWAPAEVKLLDSGRPVEELEGFPDLEHGLVVLTHPLQGFYNRRDGRLGSYNIWHDRLELTVGRVVRAHFPLLEELDLVPLPEQSIPHSVLMQHETDFFIYLPPKVLVDAAGAAGSE